MPVDPRHFLTPYQPVSFSGLNRALMNVQANRLREQQLAEQRRHAKAMEEQAAMQMAAQSRMAGEKAEALQAHRQHEYARQAEQQEFQEQKHRDTTEHQRQQRQLAGKKFGLDQRKAISGVAEKLRKGIESGMTSREELRAFQPELESMGLEMRFKDSGAMDPSELERPPPGASAEEQIAYAKRLESQAEQAATGLQTVMELVNKATGEVVSSVPVSRVEQAQRESVSRPLMRIGSFAPMSERGFYEGAAGLAGDLRGTPKQRQEAAVDIAKGMAGRQAAIRAATAAQAGRGLEMEAKAEKLRTVGFDRARKYFKDKKVQDIFHKKALANSIAALAKMRKNGVAANIVTGQLAAIWNGGRISDADFRISEGKRSLWEKAKALFAENAYGAMTEEQMDKVLSVMVTMKGTAQEGLDEAKRALGKLEKNQSSDLAREGVRMFVDSYMESEDDVQRAKLEAYMEKHGVDVQAALGGRGGKPKLSEEEYQQADAELDDILGGD